MEMIERNKGNLYILFTAFLWSLGGLLIKYIPGNPIAINASRSLIAFVFFVIYRKGIKIKINKYVILAAICLTATNTLYCMANKLTTAGNAIVIQYLAPIFVLIWDSLYKRKMPSKQQFLFVFMAFGGMVLFFLDHLGGGALLGNLLALASGVSFSGVFFVNSLPEASSEDASMLGFMLSFITGLPFITQLEYGKPSAVIALLALGIFQVGLAYVVFAKGSKMTTPVNASLIGMIEALMNPLWVFIFYGETVGKWAFVGAVIILTAVLLNILSTNKQSEA